MGDRTGVRMALLCTVAAGALLLGTARYARAEPDDCEITGTSPNQTATCQGDQSDGISNYTDFIAADVSTLIVNDLTDDIAPGSGTQGIRFVRDGIGNTVTINSNTTDGPYGPVSIVTEGANGIYTRADDRIEINHTGDIVTIGSGHGIRAYQRSLTPADISITSTGTIDVGSAGISAFNYRGSIDIVADGDIVGFIGIVAEVYGGASNNSDISIVATGDITVNNGGGVSARNRGGGEVSISVGGDITGTGGAGITAVTNGTDITIESQGVTGAWGFGIVAGNGGSGAVHITAHGHVEGTEYINNPFARSTGIYATNDGDGGIIIDSQSATGLDIGIYAGNRGDGSIVIEAHGDVIGGSFYDNAGIYAINEAVSAGGLTITADGNVEGTRGILALNNGSGDLSITVNGDVESLTVPNGAGILARDYGAGNLSIEANNITGYLFGIDAQNLGGGALTIVTDGDVQAESQSSTGIRAINNAGADLTIETRGVVRGGIGIQANHAGSGALDIAAHGDVEGDNTGINAFLGSGTDLRIAVQNVTGGNVGIVANSAGSGALEIIVNGAVTGNLVHGIDAEHINGPIQITVGAGASVTSNGTLPTTFAILTDSGATDLTVAGTLNGGGGGAVRFDQNDALDDRLTLVTGAVINGNVFGGLGTDTLALEGDGDGRFDVGQLVDFEIAEKTGGGDWTLTGTNTQLTNFTVEDGLLSVNGAMPNTAFDVTGGALGGTGTIGALTVARGGIVAPGNSIGTLTVNGNFTLDAGAIFEVEANALGQADKVIVNGTVNLSGAVLRVLAANGNYRPRTEYVIVENDGNDAVQGRFARVTTNLAFLTPTVDYQGGTGNDVVLFLERRSAMELCAVARTRNECAVANALEQFPIDDPLLLAVLSQTAAGARQVFDALSGEIHATLPGVLAGDSRYVREAVLGRLTQATYTNADGRVAALGAGGPQVASLNTYDAQAMALGYGGKHLAPPPPSYGAAFWTRAYGAWGDFDGDGNAASADRDLGGFISGVDTQISGSWRAGIAAGGAWSNVAVGDRRSNADIESFNLAGYIGGMAGAFALRGGGSWTWSEIDTSRAVVFPGFFERQESSYDADTGQIFGEIAYPTMAGRFALEPFVGLAYVSIDTDSFRERGGNLSALTGSSDNEDVGYSTLGLRAATVAQVSSLTVVPKVSAAWQHAFDDVTPGAALAFASTGIGFDILGVPLAEDSFLLEAGLDFALGVNATLGVSYTGQFADSVSDNGVKGRLTWLF